MGFEPTRTARGFAIALSLLGPQACSIVEDRRALTYSSLAEQVVLVTGGAAGIGAEIVRGFVGQGSRVVCLDVDAAAARQLADQLGPRTAGGPWFVGCDLRDIAALRVAVAQITAEWGPIGVLVNNAANDERHEFDTVDPEDFDARMAVNARHYFFACQAVRAGMVELGAGAIVNLGSIAWRIGFGGVPVYAMAKAAIAGLTRVLAREFGGDRIRVNCVEPGYVATARQRELWMTPAQEAEVLARQALPDLVEPAAVADLVLFLSADASRMCTGQTFTIDGGFT